jgi:tetratricopeptide (TPR) repeat protein
MPLVRAQLLTAQGRYREAMPLYPEALDNDNPDSLERREACFYADRAWCFLRSGDTCAALRDVDQACERAGHPADADDLAATHARVAEIMKPLGQDQKAAAHEALSLQYRAQHLAAQTEKLQRLQAALAGSTPRLGRGRRALAHERRREKTRSIAVSMTMLHRL